MQRPTTTIAVVVALLGTIGFATIFSTALSAYNMTRDDAFNYEHNIGLLADPLVPHERQ